MGGTAALTGPSISTADPQPTIAEVRAKVEELHEQAAEATERYNLGLEEVETIDRRLAKAEAAVDRQEALISQLRTELGDSLQPPTAQAAPIPRSTPCSRRIRRSSSIRPQSWTHSCFSRRTG
jgi:hypothetical protein